MRLSTPVGELERGLPRVAVDDLGNALAVWPLFRPQAGEDGTDRHPLRFAVKDGQSDQWGMEQLVPGTDASILPNLNFTSAQTTAERLLAGNGTFLLAFSEGSSTGPHNLRLMVYSMATGGAAPGWTADTTVLLDANETILDAVADGPGFVVLTGILNTNGRTWVRRTRHNGTSWLPAEMVAEEPDSNVAVVAAAAQSGDRTAVLLRRFFGGVEQLPVHFIGAALPPALPTDPVTYDTLTYTIPVSQLPGIEQPRISRCGAGVAIVGKLRSSNTGQYGVVAVTASPAIGLGTVTQVGPNNPQDILGLWSGGSTPLGCVVTWQRKGFSASDRRQQAAVNVNGVWSGMKDFGTVYGAAQPLFAGGPGGFAILYGSTNLGYLRPGVYAAAVLNLATGTWNLSGGMVWAIPLNNEAASPAPMPVLAAVGNSGYVVLWVDGRNVQQKGLYYNYTGSTWTAWSPPGLGSPVLLGGAAGGGKAVAVWSTPPDSTGVTLSSAPEGGAWATTPLGRLPAPPANVAPQLVANPFGDAVAAWRDAQNGGTYSRLYQNGEWSPTPPTVPDSTQQGEAIYLRNDSHSSVVQWSRQSVKVLDLPGGSWRDLSPAAMFNISGAQAESRGNMQGVAWTNPGGVYACVREADPWQCSGTALFDSWFPGRESLIPGPGGFALIGTGSAGPYAGRTLVRIYQQGAGWQPQAELDLAADWSMAGGYSSYMAAGARSDKLDLRLYANGTWSFPTLMGPFPEGVGGGTVRNIRVLARVGGGFAVLWEVEANGTTSANAALYRDGKWEREMVIGDGRITGAAARPEGFMAILRTPAPGGGWIAALSHQHAGKWITLPPLADGTPLRPLSVAAGRNDYGLVAMGGNALYGMRYTPGTGGDWGWTTPQRLDTDTGMLPLNIHMTVSGANYLAVWTQAEVLDPLAPQAWTAGF
ncbi:MAG: hypothetical protein OEW11_04155 [Nitrospirota bacterium]|nr:hypothetical protein [Nitrospirota bacterium]